MSARKDGTFWKTHGQTNIPEYRVWAAMKDRCLNPRNKQFRDYGGRGIQVCHQWMQFDGFISDMGLRPTVKHMLDRIDNDGNYTPKNCKWSTRIEQANNSRKNVLIECGGEKLTIAQWARKVRIQPKTIQVRIARGWAPQLAVMTPVLTSRFDARNPKAL